MAWVILASNDPGRIAGEGEQMKLIKMFGLVAVAASIAMAFVGAGSAMAEPTALCESDPGEGAHEKCPAGKLVTHVHALTIAGKKAKLLTSAFKVECDVLFLADMVEELSAPLVLEGNFTYTNCGNCTVSEVNGPSITELLKTAHEKAKIVSKGEVSITCGIKCVYKWSNAVGGAEGPLLSAVTNGQGALQEQVIQKVSGFFCPKEGTLDIAVTTLDPTYIAE